MSSYSCRNAYGRAHGRVSEHGKANAVDIGSFVTARGQAALVVAEWGPTARQIAAQAAADAKAEAATAHASAPAQAAPARPTMVPVQARHGPAGPQRRGAAAGNRFSDRSARPAAGHDHRHSRHHPGYARLPDRSPSSFGLMAPSRLGGPKPPPAAVDPSVAPGGKTDFLRAAHRSACKVFNTVLGPEANNAHLNHFHLDMAERVQNTKICE